MGDELFIMKRQNESYREYLYMRLKAKTVVSIRLGEAGNLCVYYKSTTTHGWWRPHNFRKFEKF
jgi:hypothetical protein